MLDGDGTTVKSVKNMVPLEIKPKPKCCRNLFGSPSDKEREQMSKIYEDVLKEDFKIAKEVYEYDFSCDRPLSERWELTTAPDFYTRVYKSKQERLNPLKRKIDFDDSDQETQSQNTTSCNNRPMIQLQLTSKYRCLVHSYSERKRHFIRCFEMLSVNANIRVFNRYFVFALRNVKWLFNA